MRCGNKIITCHGLQHFPQVDDQGTGYLRDSNPFSISILNFEAGCHAGSQNRQEPGVVVGVDARTICRRGGIVNQFDQGHWLIFKDEPMSLVKLIHYPPTPANSAGVNAHHDTGFLTVLAPGVTPGLEVENADGKWIAVPQIPGALVINLGEMLQAMTCNYFVATPHRVITREERYSVGYFHGPNLDTELTPLPLSEALLKAVETSPRHKKAGFMALKEETEAGVSDMASSHKPEVYGEQVWNYFVRSYPDVVKLHYPNLVNF